MSNTKPPRSRVFTLAGIGEGEVYLTHSGDRLLVAERFADAALFVQLGVFPSRVLRLCDGELVLVLAGATLVEAAFKVPESTHVLAAMQPRASIAIHRRPRSMTTGNTVVLTYMVRSEDGGSLTIGSGNRVEWPGVLQYTDTVELLARDVHTDQLNDLAARGADALAGKLSLAQVSKMTLGTYLQRERGVT